jgi:hypothetical protein
MSVHPSGFVIVAEYGNARVCDLDKRFINRLGDPRKCGRLHQLGHRLLSRRMDATFVT